MATSISHTVSLSVVQPTATLTSAAWHKPRTPPTLDELEQYLADTDIPVELDDPILDWWKVKERKWPSLAKMVKQYFAAPASSAGVERVFSAAGKMHDARRPTEISEGHDSRALSLCCVQHQLRLWGLGCGHITMWGCLSASCPDCNASVCHV